MVGFLGVDIFRNKDMMFGGGHVVTVELMPLEISGKFPKMIIFTNMYSPVLFYIHLIHCFACCFWPIMQTSGATFPAFYFPRFTDKECDCGTMNGLDNLVNLCSFLTQDVW